MGNKNLRKAKEARNDEFYTQIHDIENELRHYQDKFKGKTVYMNADHPDYSKFYWHFKMLFDFYNLKKMIATFWSPNGDAFKTIYDGKEEIRTPLKGDGDFRSDECLSILDESDIVVTNPPFSIFKEFIVTLVEHNKDFLVIGNNNALTYKDIFPLILNGDIWLGNSSNTTMEFKVPDSYEFTNHNGRIDANGDKYLKVSAISWFTNIDYPKRYEDLLLWNSYKGSEEFYPEYDNIKAINIDRVALIPYDYDGVMGVPISFIGQWNPNQFEILGIDDDVEHGHLRHLKPDDWEGSSSRPIIDGKGVYRRILIRNLNPVDEITI